MAKASELITCLTYLDKKDKPKYVIKRTLTRDMYYLFEVVDGKEVKTKHKATTPTELYSYIKD